MFEDDQKKAKYLSCETIATVGESRKTETHGATGQTKRDHLNHLTRGEGRVNSTKKKQCALAEVSLNKAAKVCADICSDSQCS